VGAVAAQWSSSVVRWHTDKMVDCITAHGLSRDALIRKNGRTWRRSGVRMKALVRCALVFAVLGWGVTPSFARADGVVPGIGGFYGGVGALYTDFDDVGHDSRFGYRLYGGFGVIRLPAVFRVTVEGGYTQTGTFETEVLDTGRLRNGDIGLQAALTSIPLLDLHARAGYEWGDTSGTHYALGASIRLAPLLRLRGEYQIRNAFNAGMLSVELRIP
jgi:hypothetical protein